jgi:hypothetical protein
VKLATREHAFMSDTPPLRLTLLDGELAVCRLAPDVASPVWADGDFVSVTRTPGELSVVCAARHVPPHVTASRGWRLLRVEGPLPLDLVGIFAALGAPLAEARVSIFPLATYDTDWLLVPGAALDRAIGALERAGHVVDR